MMRDELKQYLEGLEAEIGPIDEIKVGTRIGEILSVKTEKIIDDSELAEYLAFGFNPDDADSENRWGTYYGPALVLMNDAGQPVEFPSIREVSSGILTYWRGRASSSKHPSLSCRYADLVADFGPKVENGEFDFKMAQKVIDSTVKICHDGLDDGLGCKTKLERALALARRINDPARLDAIASAIIDAERKFAEDDKPGLWGYSIEWLVLADQKKKPSLSAEQAASLVGDLESRLARLTGAANPDPWRVECAVRPLAAFYALSGDEAALRRVLEKMEAVFRANVDANSGILLELNYLERLRDLYTQYDKYEFARASAKRLLVDISAAGDRPNDGMREISVEVPLGEGVIDKIMDGIFGKDRSENIDKIVVNLVASFVPKKDGAAKQMDDISKKYVFAHLSTQVVMSGDGLPPAAKIGPINEENYDLHLIKHYSDLLRHQAPFLSLAFVELRKRFSPDDLRRVMMLSPVYREDDKDYVLRALKLFWDADYLPFCGLMVPLVEDAVRNVFRLNGIPFVKKSKDGGYDVLSLNVLLESGVIRQVFRDYGEHIEYYFRVLLTERVGWNLRNNFAHGINKKTFDSEGVAIRLLHVLLCLSLVRGQDEDRKV